MSYKLLDLSGLQRFFNKLKDIIPTKTSELQNDSGFITQADTVDSTLSSTSEKAVQNKVIKQALDSKANDNSVVHTTGNESISGTKSFNSDLNLNYASTDVDDIIDSIPGLGTADDYVHISGNETVNGVKSFPNGIIANVTGTATPLAHTHTTSDIINLSIPSKVSDLTNDSGFITGVSWNDVSGKPSSFTPSSHSHGSITNDGKLGTTANKPLITGSNGVITTGSFGTSANTFCQGNDSRLSDARTPLSHTHGNSDITSLDASKITSGTIDIARLPKGALERLVTVANQTARFALTSSDVQLGDTVKQLDTGVMYIVSDESKLSSADGYTEYTAGSATSVPWSGVQNKPSTYTPSSHTHGNITNDGKLGTASKVLISDSNKKITTSSVSDTELGYLSGVTSAIQTQISGKANASHTHSASDITSGLATVATSGSYNDLSNKPTIPTVNNATLTIQKNGTTVKTFTANASSNVTANITVPTKVSELTNDSGYLTSHQDISGLSAKADTIKSLSISGRTITYTKGDDTTGTLTTQDNNTWTAMVGATSSANGSVGYVNAVPPKDGYNTKYLRADGTWAVPPDHTYTVNNKTLTIQKNGTSVATFTANSASDVTANIVVPTKTSDLTNDSHQTITAGTDSTSTASPAHGGTFTCIDSVTKDSNGHVTAVNTKTVTLPADNNTDTKVTQTATNSNAYYPVLVANTNIANTGTLPTTSTEGVRKSYSLSVNTRYGFLYGRNPYDTDNLKGAVAGGNRTSAAMYSLTYDNAVVGAVELGRVDKYGNRYSRLYASNYITDGALATDGTAISSVLDIGVLSNGIQYISTSGGWNCNVYPCTTNARSLGTADLKWSNVYATTFTGNLTGNVTGNVTGNCSGSSGSCTGNAATATKATNNANGKELSNSIIKGLSVSGKTITYTQIDGTTGTITTQDTNTDTLMTQNVSSTDAAYPLLLCPTANATANQGAKTGIFSSKARINASTGEIITDSQNGIRFRQSGGSKYSSFIRNDGGSTYWMVTAANTPDGTWTSARPLTINNATGICDINGNAATATNVTGTVAIANGGTGATSRLNAVKALTNENVGTSSQHFLTITSNWGKAGYCSVADAKTVLGVPTKTSQLTNDSGYLTSHQSLSNYVTLNGTQTISGAKTFSSNLVYTSTLAKKHSSVTKGTNPSSVAYWTLSMCDKDGLNAANNALGMFETSLAADGNVSTYLRAYKNTAGSNAVSEVRAKYNTTNDIGWINCTGEDICLISNKKKQGTVPTANQDCTFKMFDNSSHTMFEIRNRSVANSSNKQTCTTISVAPNTSGAAVTDAFRIYAQTENSSTVCNITAQNFSPISNNTYALGDNSHKWKTAHAVNFYENGTALTDKYVQINQFTNKNISLSAGVGTIIFAAGLSTQIVLGQNKTISAINLHMVSDNLLRPASNGYVNYISIESTPMSSGTWTLLTDGTSGVADAYVLGYWKRTS